MSKFFVGQRVRVIAGVPKNAPVGMETRIIGLVTYRGIDRWKLGIPSPGSLFDYWVVEVDRGPEFLAPIFPEGHQPATQSHEQLMADLRKGVIHA